MLDSAPQMAAQDEKSVYRLSWHSIQWRCEEIKENRSSDFSENK